MEIKKLNKKKDIDLNKKLIKKYARFEKLINELKTKKIPLDITNLINLNIGEINSFSGTNKELSKQFCKSQSSILKKIEKELNLVPKNHFRNRWMAIGLSAFGIPFGVVFGASLGNMGYIGIGMPIGMAIGMAIGAGMDKKAFEEGRQLDFEVNC